jgi:hypothetical protein
LAASAPAARLGADPAGGQQAGPSDERGPEGAKGARASARLSTRHTPDARKASRSSCQEKQRENYTRSDDGEEMVEIAPRQFVSRKAAAALGLSLAPLILAADAARAAPRGRRKSAGSPSSPAADAAERKSPPAREKVPA